MACPALFDHEIDIAKDRVVRDADDAANRVFLDRPEGLRQLARRGRRRVREDGQGGHGWQALRRLGATGGFRSASVLGYGATYGAGAAVVQFHVA